MRAEDQFHTGIVVDDFEATLAELTELLGYESYHRRVGGPRIELVSRSVQAGLEQCWATGGGPS